MKKIASTIIMALIVCHVQAQYCPDDHHPHKIDLGLPSGTKWACCNVGAASPMDAGNFYAWGEKEEKKVYSKENYLYKDKYLGMRISGTQHDVARMKWGGLWQMPTNYQILELQDHCTVEYLKNDQGENTDYCVVTGRNNKQSIILPAYLIKVRKDDSFLDTSSGPFSYSGHHWSGEYSGNESQEAYILSMLTDNNYQRISFGNTMDRSYGMPVRPVTAEKLIISDYSYPGITFKKVQEYRDLTIQVGSGTYAVGSSDPSVAEATLEENCFVRITAVGEGSATVIIMDLQLGQTAKISVRVGTPKPTCPDDNHPHMIDLGLPSGTKWACCNVGAATPMDVGSYYAWGETEEKEAYNEGNYLHKDKNLGLSISGTQYDVAQVKWGGSWQMPSQYQINELIENCTEEFIEDNSRVDSKYCYVRGPNKAVIALPADIVMVKESDKYRDYNGTYWAGENPDGKGNPLTCSMSLNTPWPSLYLGSMNCSYGAPVRPVSTETLLLSTASLTFRDAQEEKTVKIDIGSGDYEVSSSDIKVATVTLEGNLQLKITAVGEGSASITVTDKRLGKTKTVAVTVKFPEQVCPDDNHPHMIDLGLPSGTKWACRNVGATNIEDPGSYFAWGETEEKEIYSEENYIYKGQDLDSRISGSQHDAAQVRWGGSWQTPTYQQYAELLGNCSKKKRFVDGKELWGYQGPNGGWIYLPETKGKASGGIEMYNRLLWTGDEDMWYSITTRSLCFCETDAYSDITVMSRWIGMPIRPVAIEKLVLSTTDMTIPAGHEETVEVKAGSGSYDISSKDANVATAKVLDNFRLQISPVGEGTTIITVTDKQYGLTASIEVRVIGGLICHLTCPDDNHPHIIDLGLPSGRKWACCNVGASKPEEIGDLYAWGETETKSTYTLDNYRFYYPDEDSDRGYYFIYVGDNIYGTQYDAAYVKWGSLWQMPNGAAIDELVGNCTYEWTTLNGVKGGMFTAQNGGCIFLPDNDSQHHVYWSGVGISWQARGHYLQPWNQVYDAIELLKTGIITQGSYGYKDHYGWNRYEGQLIRPVINTTAITSKSLGMEQMEMNPGTANQAVYSIQGVKVADKAEKMGHLPAGIYILNGRKIVVK